MFVEFNNLIFNNVQSLCKQSKSGLLLFLFWKKKLIKNTLKTIFRKLFNWHLFSAAKSKSESYSLMSQKVCVCVCVCLHYLRLLLQRVCVIVTFNSLTSAKEMRSAKDQVHPSSFLHFATPRRKNMELGSTNFNWISHFCVGTLKYWQLTTQRNCYTFYTDLSLCVS